MLFRSGFFGKVYLFAAGISAGEIVIVIIAGLNSAVSAWYYLKIAGLPWLTDATSTTENLETTPYLGRRVAVVLSAAGVVALIFSASPIMTASHEAMGGLGSEVKAVESASEIGRASCRERV